MYEFTCANLWLSLLNTNSENDTDEGAELKPRAGSAAASLIGAFYDHPVMGTEEIEASAGSAISQVYRAIDQLVNAGFIEEITGRKGDRVWAASEVMAELDDLDHRIQTAM
jgi:DNA-binding MarR family transcriptional regulator